MRVGRPRKAGLNSVVFVHAPRYGLPRYGVIVAARNDVRWGRYRVVETDIDGRHPRGAAVWLDSTEFTPTEKFNKTPGRRYRAVIKAGGKEMLGCDCLCGGPHIHGFEPEPDD